MSMFVRTSNYGYRHRPGITVETTDEGEVCMSIDGETEDDEAVDRVLESGEARSLAAALIHYAAEVEAGRRD